MTKTEREAAAVQAAIRRSVDNAPQLTAEQRTRLALLLRPGADQRKPAA